MTPDRRAPAGDVGTSVGIEEEYHLVDPATGAIVQRPALAGDDRAGGSGPDLQNELQVTQLEAAGRVCESLDDLRAELVTMRGRAAALADEAGATILATGTHPFADWRDLERTRSTRYDKLEYRFGALSQRLEVCGCHVHVGVPDLDLAVAVMTHARPYLPLLLTLTASSPFHDGVDTGFASFRTVRWSTWPIAGPPPALADAAAYRQLVDELVASGIIDDASNLYWDIRPSDGNPTLEFRVADVCTDLDHAVLYAALARALVRTLAARHRAGAAPAPVSEPVLRAQIWQAARFGMAAHLRVPASGEIVPARIALRQLVSELGTDLAEREETHAVEERLKELLASGNSADRQRRTFAATQDLRCVVAAASADTLAAVRRPAGPATRVAGPEPIDQRAG
jgi:carboxylate-amine ligase